jgi:hypothetical protein
VDSAYELELKIHQSAIRPEEYCSATVDCQSRVADFERLTIGHFDDERHERFAVDQFNDFLFDLLWGHVLFLTLHRYSICVKDCHNGGVFLTLAAGMSYDLGLGGLVLAKSLGLSENPP